MNGTVEDMPNPPAFRSGDVLHLTRAASPQFVHPIRVRVIRVLSDLHPPYGWEWIDAYQIDPRGQATARRSLFVLVEGVQKLTPRPDPAPVTRRPIRRTPVKVGA